MEASFGSENRVFAEQFGDGFRVSRDEDVAMVLEDNFVHFRVCGHYYWCPQNVGFEHFPISRERERERERGVVTNICNF